VSLHVWVKNNSAAEAMQAGTNKSFLSSGYVVGIVIVVCIKWRKLSVGAQPGICTAARKRGSGINILKASRELGELELVYLPSRLWLWGAL